MWIFGLVGTEKSAIAQTIAERCLAAGLFLAAFFFSRFDPTRNHLGSLVATLAYQIRAKFPVLGTSLKILIASRPEQTFSFAFNSINHMNLTTRLPLNQTYLPQRDIRVLLEDKFNHPSNESVYPH